MGLTLRAAVILFLVAAGSAHAATLNVPADYPTIQSAINAASPNDTVLVTPGIYTESINLLGKLIAVKSSGGPAVTTIQADRSNPSVISCISGEPIGSLISGFTITGGMGSPIQGGGGLLIIKSAVTVYECIFEGNTAVQGGGVSLIEGELFISNCTFNGNHALDEGGGLHSSNAELLADHCTFNANCAHFGGAVNVHGGSAGIFNCDFLENHASANLCAGKQDAGRIEPARGGALHADSASITIYNGEFFDNTADLGGAVDLLNCTPLIELCDFTGNQASMNGGGVHFAGSPLQLECCDFNSNTAAGGGALAGNSHFEDTLVSGCTFRENSANDGGALLLEELIGADFANCLFDSNTAAQSGGAVLNIGDDGFFSTPTFINCTFAGNSAPPNGGSVLRNGSSAHPFPGLHVQFHNCILWHNSGTQIVNSFQATTDISFSNVQGGYQGEGNIDADPLFVSPFNRRLASGSPCLDAGDNDALPAGLEQDLDDEPRIENGIVDMGAYEGSICIADFWPPTAPNSAVDADELVQLINNWGPCPPPEFQCIGNLNGDEVVDVDDLLVVINNWGPCE